MYRNIRRAMAVMFGLALSAAMSFPVLAQDEELMQDVTQDEPVVEESVAEEYGKGCGKGGCDDCCGGAFYGEFQYVRLDTHESYEDTFDDIGSEDGYRIVLGYAGCDGLGARARYFDFDGVQNDGGPTGLDLWYLDLELTQTFNLCCLNGVVSGGYRHAETERFDGGLSDTFDGDGVTLGLMLDRDISCNLGVFAWTQYSMLYGEDAENDVDSSQLDWTEVQLGAQYSMCLGGYNTVARGGVEAQRHGEWFSTDNSTGLIGWFLSAGVTY